mmetsp:Transcript_42048/g.131731  ORF Transcript_42048/g.131731 Transcript_42048/m.131731 type:complete len:418 (-) Transcript_42048:123-1376(-)
MGVFQSKPRYLNNGAAEAPVEVDTTAPLEPQARRVLEAVCPQFLAAGGGELEVTTVTGGVTNMLYRVSGPGAAQPVLVRVYGLNTEVLIDRERENRIFAALSAVGAAPTFFGRFRGGRVEELLDARPLEMEELPRPEVQDLLAPAIARLHGSVLKAPGADKLMYVDAGDPVIVSFLRRWFPIALEVALEGEPERQAQLEALGLAARQRAAARLEVLLRRVREAPANLAERFLGQVVFSHQDILAGNVLFNEAWGHVRLIDFEYAGANMRGYDFGNHFCEHGGLVPGADMEECYPTMAVRQRLLRRYLEAVGELGDAGLGLACSEADAAVTKEAVARAADPEFLKELADLVDLFSMACSAAWGAWSVVQAKYSPIDFDYLTYAKSRFDGWDGRHAQAKACYQHLAEPQGDDAPASARL